MTRQSAEKWYASQARFHEKRISDQTKSAPEISWHKEQAEYWRSRLAALSVKGK